MISAIHVCSYWRMVRLAPTLPDTCAVVSILNPPGGPSRRYGSEAECPPGLWSDLESEPIFAEGDPRVLVLRFWDVEDDDSPDPAFYAEWPPITQAQADAIAAFLRAAQEDPVAMPLYAHCAGGISRSAAVAEVAAMLAGIPWDTIQAAAQERLHPNATVKARVLRALGLVPLGEGRVG